MTDKVTTAEKAVEYALDFGLPALIAAALVVGVYLMWRAIR